MIDKHTMHAVEEFIHAGYPPDAGAALLIEVEGLREETEDEAAAVRAICREQRRARSPRRDRRRRTASGSGPGRKAALGALGRRAPSYYILDGVVPRTKLPAVLDGVYETCERYGLPVANVFHAGDGNLHPNLLFDERVPGATERVLELRRGDHARCAWTPAARSPASTASASRSANYMTLDLLGGRPRGDGPPEGAPSAASEAFNPGKVFPTSKGCGEVSSRMRAAMAKVGPGAYV